MNVVKACVADQPNICALAYGIDDTEVANVTVGGRVQVVDKAYGADRSNICAPCLTFGLGPTK